MRYYLFLFFLASCGKFEKIPDPIKFPYIVQNDCGKFAVRTKMYISTPFEGGKDTTWWYLGKNYDKGMSLIISSGTWYPPDSLQKLKDKRHQEVWADIKDTVYDNPLYHEIIFDDSISARAAINSYIRRGKLEADYSDSISKCHKYH